MKRTFDALLKELRTASAVPEQAKLYHLSCLSKGDAAEFRAVWTDVHVEQRREIVAILVEIAEADIEVNFDTVFRIGIEDPDAEVRARSIAGLWENEDIRLVPILAERLLEDESAEVRKEAAISLGRFLLLGELEKIREKPMTIAYDALLIACRDPEEPIEVRRRALESLAYAGTDVVENLIREAYKASSERMRVSAVFAMGRSADPVWSPEVRQELFSPNPELRYEAARASGELQLEEAVSQLEELAEDADPEVQEAALWALGQIGGDRARALLEHYCQSPDEATRAAAEAAMDQLEFLHGDLTELFNRLMSG